MVEYSPAPASSFDDIRAALSRPRLWHFLARREIARQFDRTILGLLWVPVNVLIHVAFLGFIFSKLLGGGKYLPHVAIGFAVWTTFARGISEAANLWPSSQMYLRHLNVPLSLFVVKLVWKVILVLGLTLPVGLAFCLLDGVYPSTMALLALPGGALYIANLPWMLTLVSVLGVRFRDLARFVPNFLYVAYLSTPILWQRDRLGEYAWIADYNPLYHLIELIRAPILGDAADPASWVVALGMAVVGNAVALLVFAGVRRKVVLWL
jgi:lipopolysaccharide transport system permease protein